MTGNVPKPQNITAKKAESQRPFHGQAVIDDPNVRSLFRGRAHAILADLNALKQKGVSFSPFLEIGAGSVQRSAALINNYPTKGVATDISQKSLQDTPYVLSMLDYDLSPMLISCDAHHIPFLPNSFQFVFAYQTLHHFENPIPVLAECYRVLGKDGHLFFSEEPMDSSFRRFLRGNRMLSHPPTRMQKLGYRLGVQKVFWDDGTHERSLGMTEARFDIDLWRKALETYTIIDIEINQKLKIHSNLQAPVLNSFLSGLIGGNVKGLCFKEEGEVATDNFRERLMCLDCKLAQLSRIDDKQFVCENCDRVYPITDGIIRILPKQLELELYPEHS
ncbi:MAG: methyltransferase domain-containing protein [Deltaproteobacteria bacterium]|nr:methyltransferase domain-containing protein [Deltaproteobacteria bacterium]